MEIEVKKKIFNQIIRKPIKNIFKVNNIKK